MDLTDGWVAGQEISVLLIFLSVALSCDVDRWAEANALSGYAYNCFSRLRNEIVFSKRELLRK